MKPPRLQRKPRFLWQGLLILLPVALLAVMGFVSLRQDRQLARREAAERAHGLAQDVLARLVADLLATNAPPFAGNSFQVDAYGDLLFPPACPPVPAPAPLPASELDPKQAELWRRAQTLLAESTNSRASLEVWRHFLDSAPPAPFAAQADYVMGLLLADAADPANAVRHFETVANQYPDALGESGLPLRPLSWLKILELRNSAGLSANPTNLVSIDSVCSDIVQHPSPLTPFLLDRIAAWEREHGGRQQSVPWQRLWEDLENARRLYRAASARLRAQALQTPAAQRPISAYGATNAGLPGLPPTAPLPVRLFWFTADTPDEAPLDRASIDPAAAQQPPGPWLAVASGTSPTQTWWTCWSEQQIGAHLSGLASADRLVPEYFGVGLEIAGRPVSRAAPDLHAWHEFQHGGKGSWTTKEYLPELAIDLLASATRWSEDHHAVIVSVYLTSPSVLFKHQRARSFWLGSLVALAAGVALIGLFSVWRAYTREQQLNELKSNFVSSVSHELRSPIASVRLLAESLELGKVSDPPHQREYFHFIVRECRRLSSLIENVLDFSRIEQGRKQFEFEPTDVGKLVRETVKLMAVYGAEREVTLTVVGGESPAEPLLQPVVDGKAVQQALVNLIDNAIKHSPKGGTVEVGLEWGGPEVQAHAGPGSGAAPPSRTGRLRLWVEDRGEGIPPAEQQKIFERFYRSGSELRRHTQGVGIGLSIVKHIVEAHGGRVTVRSEVGKGSRFTMEFERYGTHSDR